MSTLYARVWLALTALALVAVSGGGAGAAPGAGWQVPEECGGSARLAARIATQAGRPWTDAEPMTVAVDVRAQAEGGYLAAIDVMSVRGAARREVRGADCAAVVDAVALVLAVAMQEVAAPRVEQPVAPVVREPARFLVGVGLGVDQGALPEAVGGAAVVIALGLGRWRVEVGGEVFQAAYAPTADDEARGVEVGLLGGRARLCRRLGPARACVGGALGRLEGRPVGLFDAATRSRRWSAVTAGLGWSYRFGGRFAIGVDVEGVLAVDRPEFVLDDLERLHRPAAGGLRAGCGFEVEIR